MTTSEGVAGFGEGLSFIDALGDGVYGVDTHGMCLFVNAAAVRLLGYDDRAELVGCNMHERIHHTRPDGSVFPKAECPLLHTLESGRAVTLDNEMLWRKDGSPFLAEYCAYPVRQAGAVTGSIITFSDIAARRGAQKRLALQYTISRLLSGDARPDMAEALLATIGSGLDWDIGLFWQVRSENGHESMRCTATWRSRQAGRSAEFGTDAIGMTLELGAGLPGQAWLMESPIHVADLQDGSGRQELAGRYGLRSGFAFPIMTGTSVIGAIEFYNRQRIEVDEGLQETVGTLGQQIGQTMGRRRVEGELKEIDLRLRTLADAMPQLAWMLGPDGGVQWYNQRWYDYTGTDFAQMAGWGWRSVHHPDHVVRVEQKLRECIALSQPWEDTFPLRARDGTWRWFLSRASPILGPADAEHPAGVPIGWFGTNTDITGLREVEQRLLAARDEAEAANRAKSTFLANMSHELRTPLSAIIGYAEMLAEEIEEDPEPAGLVRDLQKIEANARHLLGLINDVLDLSKIEAGKMEAFAETFDVPVMLDDVANTVRGLVEKSGNTLRLDIGAGLGSMQSDVTRVRQVLLNLLGNAAKFTKDGTVSLSARREGGTLVFSVTDTGIGMTKEQLNKLFQRFQQADASTTRQFGGTGLGLALCRAFTSLLGGDLDVSSVPGEGSTFTARLPDRLPERHAPAAGEPAEQEPAAADRPLVLVVDDDGTQRELMSRFLVKAGYQARTAPDGESGLAMARALRPHAILLDVTMPGMDGWSVLTRLKNDADLAAIPVVMVTFTAERALAAALGAADYVAKPVDWDRLRQVMERFVPAEGGVLVVDDDTDTRARLRHVLEREGWTVAEAANGQEALDQVSVAIPQVILLDLSMPVMDGFEFLHRLRERPGCASVPVLVMTALDLDAADRVRLETASDVLRKGETGMHDIADRLRRIGALAGTEP